MVRQSPRTGLGEEPDRLREGRPAADEKRRQAFRRPDEDHDGILGHPRAPHRSGASAPSAQATLPPLSGPPLRLGDESVEIDLARRAAGDPRPDHRLDRGEGPGAGGLPVLAQPQTLAVHLGYPLVAAAGDEPVDELPVPQSAMPGLREVARAASRKM